MDFNQVLELFDLFEGGNNSLPKQNCGALAQSSAQHEVQSPTAIPIV